MADFESSVIPNGSNQSVAAEGGQNASEDGAPATDGPHIALVPPCRLVVKATAGARVVGKGGESIRSIRSSSGAAVRVFQDELPEPLRRRDENIVVASCGETSSLRAALSGILQRIFDRSGLPDHAERERERPYVVDVVVPERAAGPLVGPGGERVKALIEELGCSIDVVREPLAGIAAQRRVRVLSREQERVEVAVWRIQEILSELIKAGTLSSENFELREALPTEYEQERMRHASREIPMRLVLTPNEAAVVVGKMGFNVRRLRDIASVSVDDATSPSSGQREAICTVNRATLEDRLRVVRLIAADLSASVTLRRGDPLQGEGAAPEGCRPVGMRVLLPTDRWTELCDLLQSSDGACPSSCPLSTESSVQASVQSWGQLRSTELRMVDLNGTEEQVAAAIWRLHQALEPWEPKDVPPRREPHNRSHDEADGSAEGKGSGKAGGKGGGKRGPVGEQIVPVRRPPPPDAADRDRILRFGAPSQTVPDAGRSAAPSASIAQETGAAAVVEAVAEPEQFNAAGATSGVTAVVSSQTEGADLPTTARGAVVDGDPPVMPAAEQPSWTAAHPSSPPKTSQEHVEFRVEAVAFDAGAHWSLKVQVPNARIAAFIISDASGVARRAGVKIQLWGASGDCPILEITGNVVANAVACHLIQEQLWMAASF